MSRRLLVVDDEAANRKLIGRIFRDLNFELLDAAGAEEAFAAVTAHPPDVVLLDLHLPGVDGLTILERLREQLPSLPVVMLTGSRDVRHAVRAIRLGAFDYLTKPIDAPELIATVRRAYETGALRAEVAQLRRQVNASPDAGLLQKMGPSAQARRVLEQVRRVAGSTFTVLIQGETGTGKELVAQAVHHESDRCRRPFVALDCGAIPENLLESELFGHERGAFTGADRRKEGRFRLAEGGTCFLDEIGNMPLGLQAKLLRVIESKQVQAVGAERPLPMDVRFVAATNDDLQDRVARGQFRADLYFRLAQYTIALPPLRERPADIAYLAQRFMDEAAVDLRRPLQGIVPEAVEKLQLHTWPGNVRELRNVIRQAVLHAELFQIRPADIRFVRSAPLTPAAGEPEDADPAPARSLKEVASQAAAAAERRAIVAALRAAGGNKSRAARALQTDYKTLHLKMRALGIRPGGFGAQ